MSGISIALQYAAAPAIAPLSRFLEFFSALGPYRREAPTPRFLAPMANISRRIPPAPVAAPSYGLSNGGWLCGLILKTAQYPLFPIFTAPASLFMLWSTYLLSFMSSRSLILEFL